MDIERKLDTPNAESANISLWGIVILFVSKLKYADPPNNDVLSWAYTIPDDFPWFLYIEKSFAFSNNG